MRWLCISDIQGDADALGAVLATAEQRGYSKLLCAGDLCFPGPDPVGVLRRLKEAGAISVQGVSDRAVASLDPASLTPSSEHERERMRQLQRVRDELGPGQLEWLMSLDTAARFPLPNGTELLLVHGSPADPTEPFSHEMSDDEMRALLADDPADIIVCGGSHIPFDRTVMGVRIINVGSVGAAIHSGLRHAEATFLEFSISGGASYLEVYPIIVPLEDPDEVRATP